MTERPILLVEDNPDDVDLTLRALKKNRIANEVVVAGDGEDAIDLLFRDEPLCPGLVLLDVKLPRMSGIEVLARIRADRRTSFLPVVMLTSSTDERDMVEAYGHFVNSYVRKPIDFNEFIEVANQIGMYWLLVNRVPFT